MDFQLIFEAALTIGIIGIQLFFFKNTKKRISELVNVFPAKPLAEKNISTFDTGEETVEVIEIEDYKYSDTLTDIVNSINNYLIGNKGAIDFSIIKSVVERNVELKEEEITSNISLPLYIGLMGTFLGIIVGLVKIAFSGIQQENIDSFIGGVFIAMIASMLGLLFTVINNSGNFKKAKKINDNRKNDFYNFLQIELLPHLGNSIYDVFNRFKDNISDFNTKFSSNITKFDQKFSDNIDSLKGAVESIAENVEPIIENIQTQKDFLRELRGKGYDKIVAANLKTFEIMERAVPNFITFIDKQKELNSSIDHTVGIVHVIERVMDRVSRFENSINALGDRIDNADYMSSDLLTKIKKKLDELDNQFELLKQHSQYSKGEIERHFQTEATKITVLSEKLLREVNDALNFDITDNPLIKLRQLDSIQATLKNISEKPDLQQEVKQIAVDLANTKQEIRGLKERVINELDKNNKPKKSRKEDEEDSGSETKQAKRSFWKKLNPFRRRKKKNGKGE